MVKSDSSLVLIQKGKRRTCNGYRAINTQTGGYPPYKLGLACAQLSGEGDKTPRLQQSPKPLTQPDSLFNTVRSN